MKKVKLFEQFVNESFLNESISFDKKGIKAKLADKVKIDKVTCVPYLCEFINIY